jgi:glycosyltransferase involved in cell wall biosynthesis
MVERGISREKITVVPNGIDPAAFGEVERDEALRRELRLDGRFAVGYVGNLDHWREGMDVLISAVAELHRRGRTEVAGLIVGDGTGREGLEAHARRIGIAEHVRFTGRVPHDVVPRYYAQFDLFLNPRVEERAARYITPLKPYEAMAVGLPVLVSDLPALTEIVDPPHRGHAARAGDRVALADAIEALVDDPPERARIARAGREWVRTERTWAGNGDRYREAYERVLRPPA